MVVFGQCRTGMSHAKPPAFNMLRFGCERASFQGGFTQGVDDERLEIQSQASQGAEYWLRLAAGSVSGWRHPDGAAGSAAAEFANSARTIAASGTIGQPGLPGGAVSGFP